jgi:hypothetical protein
MVIGAGLTIGCSSTNDTGANEEGIGGSGGGAAGGPGGGLGEACTLIGCGAAFTATVAGASADFPPGLYQVDVTADGASFSGTFTWPQDPEGGFMFSTPVQPINLLVTLFLNSDCRISGCDAYVETIQLMPWTNASPAEIRIQQSVDGRPMLDRTIRPNYTEYAPNGQACGPTCFKASVEWPAGS